MHLDLIDISMWEVCAVINNDLCILIPAGSLPVFFVAEKFCMEDLTNPHLMPEIKVFRLFFV